MQRVPREQIRVVILGRETAQDVLNRRFVGTNVQSDIRHLLDHPVHTTRGEVRTLSEDPPDLLRPCRGPGGVRPGLVRTGLLHQ